MSERGAKAYGGVTVAPFGGSGDVRTNLMPADLADLEALVGDLEVATALVIGAELEPMTIAVHVVSGARTTAGVGAFGSWHDPTGDRVGVTVPAGLDLPMVQLTSSDLGALESAVEDTFGDSSLDLVVDLGTAGLARAGAFWSLLPRLSPGARYLLRRTTPNDIVANGVLKELETPDIVPAVIGTAAYQAAALAHEASLHLSDATSPIARLDLGRSWAMVELASSDEANV